MTRPNLSPNCLASQTSSSKKRRRTTATTLILSDVLANFLLLHPCSKEHLCVAITLLTIGNPTMSSRLLVLAIVLFLPPVSLADDKGWPQQFEKKDWTVTLYQPQPESLEDINLKARMAVSVEKEGSPAPSFGAVWLTATLDIDRDDRMVYVDEIHVDKVKFPNSTEEQQKNLAEFLEDEIPDLDLEISLDRLLAAIDQTQFQMKSSEALKNDPPKIIVMTSPAILITIDGNPQTRKIKDTELERVFNTTFPIV